MAQRRQLGGQGAVVVNFAVKDDDKVLILAVQRLCAAVGVNDGQTAVAQRGGPLHKAALTVRPAVGNARQHGGQQTGVCRTTPGNKTGNSAHGFYVLSRQCNLPLPFCTLDLLAFYHGLW